MEKTGNILSLIYLEIYHIVDFMCKISKKKKKKKSKILADKLDKFPSKKKKSNCKFLLG
jgi:hypothetical protein